MFLRKFLFVGIIISSSVLASCSYTDEPVVIVEVDEDYIYTAPYIQDPEEQYTLSEVKISPQAMIYGKAHNENALRVNDVILIDYTSQQNNTAKIIERFNE